MEEVGSCTDRLRVIAIIIPALSEGFLCHLKARQSGLSGVPTPNHPNNLLPNQENNCCYSAESFPSFICFKGRFMMLCIPGAGSCSQCISKALSWIILMDTKIFSSLRVGETLGLPEAGESLMPKSHWRTDLVCFYSQPLLQTNTSAAKVRFFQATPQSFLGIFVFFQSDRDGVERSQSMCQWPVPRGRETALELLRSWK